MSLDASFFAASPEDVGVDPAKLEALFERAEREVQQGLLPAVQIAIARNGKLAGFRSFGNVKHEGRPAPATNDTLFCVFSCTKAITSAAAWLLIQEGKLAIDERVTDIVPEFGTHGKDVIRVEQLLTHTAGFPRAPFPPTDFLDRKLRLQRFADWRLNWEPGSRFEYHPSSSMYVVAEIIERRSGHAFGDFVRERIAKPLGLPDLWVGLPRALHARLADIEHVGEKLTAEDYARMGLRAPPETEVTEDALTLFNRPEAREAGIPGGGGTMTAAELALFYQALLHEGRGHDGTPIWQPDVLRMARQIRSGELRDPGHGRLANRALGIIIAGDADRTFRGFGHTNSELAFGHGGAGGQIAWADPATGISIGYCTSGHDRNPLRAGRRTVGIGSRAASVGA
ncbi:MAG: serine hydrolase domain-containing protein [Polyangiales bacterium]